MPTFYDTSELAYLLMLLGTAVFALSGAIMAARERQTFVTMAFFALITGVGGGSIRDILIGAPVFWIHDPLTAPACLGVALMAWFTPHKWWDGQLAGICRRARPDGLCGAGYGKVAQPWRGTGSGHVDGSNDRLRRRHHPGHGGGCPVDPDAPGTLRHACRPFRSIVRIGAPRGLS